MASFARTFLACVLLCVCAASAHAQSTGTLDAGQSFVYVVTAPPICVAVPCPSGELLVFDAATKEVVTSSPLGTAQNLPVGMAMAHNGRRLYISMRAADNTASLAVYDVTRHQMGPTYSMPDGVSGGVAVSGDNQRVFVAGSTNLVIWNVQTSTVTTSVDEGYVKLLAHPALHHVIATKPGVVSIPIVALDENTGAALDSTASTFNRHLSLSPDGTRIYSTQQAFNPSSGGYVQVLDAASLQFIQTLRPCQPSCFSSHTFDAPGAGRILVLDATLDVTGIAALDRSTTTVAESMFVPHGTTDGVVTGDDARFWKASQLVPTGFRGSGDPRSANALTVLRVNPLSLERTIPLASAPLLLGATPPPGAGRCSYRIDTAYASFADPRGAGVPIHLSTGCGWSASADAPWIHLSAADGAASATITITADQNTTSATRQGRVVIAGQVVTVTQAGPGSQPAFGFIDTPIDFATNISGALAISGWALDDVGVAAVHIYRDPLPAEPQLLIPLGTATLVEGARPDVQSAFSSLPFASRAGWGYQLLTNMLPGGDGTHRLHVFVEDLERHSTYLGSRTITVDNGRSSLPFGALDAPGQGESVSGVILTWGWALTPQPGSIAVDGSTIDVVIDGVVSGHPTFGLDRSDIAALFPGYANTNSAVGYFMLDTRTLSNGVHTIAWVVRDSLGRAQGIGSRFFNVFNP